MSSHEFDDVPGAAGEPVDPFTQLDAAIAALGEVDLGAFTAHGRAEFLRAVERASRRVSALQTAQVDVVDRDGLYGADGHWSAAVMVRHVGRLSGGEARWRHRAAKALRDLPEWAAAYAAGAVGTCQVRRISRVWANPRVRDLLPAAEADLLVLAQADSYKFFDAACTQWERTADVDGTIDKDSIAEKASLRREYDGTWKLEATLRSATGVVLDEIFKRFCDAELLAGEKAKAEHGDAATVSDLPRSEPQRRADALKAMFFDAAATPPGSKDARMLINLVMPYDRYQAELEALAGVPRSDEAMSVAERLARCGTLDGTWIDPWDAVRLSIGAELRRVVVGADGAVINVSRTNRFFRGSARDAVMLRHPECVWAGCENPDLEMPSRPHRPLVRRRPDQRQRRRTRLGRHNRLENTRFQVWCDPEGRWHTYRPDGTEISTAAPTATTTRPPIPRAPAWDPARPWRDLGAGGPATADLGCHTPSPRCSPHRCTGAGCPARTGGSSARRSAPTATPTIPPTLRRPEPEPRRWASCRQRRQAELRGRTWEGRRHLWSGPWRGCTWRPARGTVA